jgi:hypothetical protein
MLREANQEQRTCQATRDQLKLRQLKGQTTTEGRLFLELQESLRLALSGSLSNLQSRQIVMSPSRPSSQRETRQTYQPNPPFPHFDLS